MWQVFFMYALFGSIFSIGKIGLAASQPYFLTGIRMLLAGCLMMSYLYWKTPSGIGLKNLNWFLILLVAFFNVFITNAFEFWGLQYMSAGKTCLIYSLSPFAAALIAYFFGTENMTGKKWLGLLVGICSFLPIMLVPWLSEQTPHSQELVAEGALVISAITAVIGWTFVRQLTIEQKVDPVLVNGLSFLLAGMMSLATSGFLETWEPLPVFNWSHFLLSLIYITFVHNIVCYSIYAASLKRFSVTFMAFAGLSNPLFAALFGWLFLKESISFTFWVALTGVLLGLYLFYQEEKKTDIVVQN